jgi:hypothetical protein
MEVEPAKQYGIKSEVLQNKLGTGEDFERLMGTQRAEIVNT